MSVVPLPISSLLPHNIKALGWCISTNGGVGGNGTGKHPSNLCAPHTLGRVPKACHDKEHSSPASMLVEEDGASWTKQIWRGKEPVCLCLQLTPPFAQPFPTLTPSCCYLSGLGWDFLWSLLPELFKMAVGILAKHQTNHPSSNTECMGSKTLLEPAVSAKQAGSSASAGSQRGLFHNTKGNSNPSGLRFFLNWVNTRKHTLFACTATGTKDLWPGRYLTGGPGMW